MLNRERELGTIAHDMEEEEVLEEWSTPFSAQHTFESFMRGGPKHLRTLNAKAERMLKAPDGSTTEQYKNKQRERECMTIWRDGVFWLVWKTTLFYKLKCSFIVCVCVLHAYTLLSLWVSCVS